jgi:hypothetical protein
MGEAQITQAHKDSMTISQADIFPYEGIWSIDIWNTLRIIE